MPFLKNIFSTPKTGPKAGMKSGVAHPDLGTILRGERVILRVETQTDWAEWSALRDQSRAFLTPWEPTWSPDCLSYDYYGRSLRRHWREWRNGEAYAFLICASRDLTIGSLSDIKKGSILGGLALTEIHRGIAQHATIGYWIGAPFAGQGLMTEAVTLACDFALQTLRLNRIQAACLPRNEHSKRLLEKTGFALEGKARNYLRINGTWEDHLLWAKLAGEG